MKNLNKLIRILQSYSCLGLYFGILQAQVVITEFFINSAEGTQIPQYIELYNTSSDPIPLEGWSIITKNEIDEESSFSTQFTSTNTFASYAGDPLINENSEIIHPPFEIQPHGYFLISSNWIGGDIFSNNHNSDIEVLFILAEAGSIFLYKPGISDPEDQVEYDISDSNWPIKTGHSMILQLSDDTWSLSPEKEKSSFLYEGSEILNYGSPREENAFKLTAPENYVHIISGDIADYSYGDSLIFSWKGTFYEVTDQSYRLIIKKLDSWKPTMHGFGADTLDKSDTLIWEGISDTIYPVKSDDLLIDQLEVANYTWTVELTKTYSGIIDTIYSDEYTFTINASDYGIYGCVDGGCCTNDPNEVGANGGCPILCPTSADDDTLKSNHPTSCTPGVDCFSAINYHETANINSNTCHYVSLSIPAFVVDSINTIVTVPVYLYNDSSANIDSIAYTLSFDSSSVIISYENGTFSGTVISELGDENINYDGPDSISVDMALSAAGISFNGAGIITYLAFKLIGSPSEVMGLTFSSPIIIGGEPKNNIQVPVKDGEFVILQPNYEIDGRVVYYWGNNPYEIPNVEVTLEKKYDGNPEEPLSVTVDTNTNESGYYHFESLKGGHYSLSFSKEDEYDILYCTSPALYVSGTDISDIANHVTGYLPLDDTKLIAADVSLDGTISGLDVSLVAQYSVELIDNLNALNTHWIFKPSDTTTLAEIYADLIKDNGEYMIEYSPLVFDDEERDIYAYRLGDVNGNYCYDHNNGERYKKNDKKYEKIVTHHQTDISISIMVSEPTYIKGVYLEIGYEDGVFNPLSFIFDPTSILSDNYESLSNLYSNNGTIKTVIWATHEPLLVSGLIGEVNFSWDNENDGGEIWLENFIINDAYASGGITLSGYDGEEISDGLNIINELYALKLSLQQNYPNPFNPQTSIFWSMPGSGKASIEIYNLKGQFIDILFDGYKEPGSHAIIWNASAYPSGIYFYRLTIDETVLQKKMILLR